MKTNNAFVDALIESQSQALNNWLEATQKMQNAIATGNAATEGPAIYKEWLEKQMALAGGTVTKLTQNVTTPQNQVEDFFKNWFQSQMDYVKKITDFNQSVFSSYANFGRPANDYINTFSNINNQWTNIYNEWVKATTTTFETYQSAFKDAFTKNLFQEMLQSNYLYNSFKELYTPIFEAFQKGEYKPDVFKQFYDVETYKKLTDKIFGGLFNTTPDLQKFFDNAMNQIHSYFSSNNALREQYINYYKKLVDTYPQLFTSDFNQIKELYSKYGNIYYDNFKPLLNLINNPKEKEALSETLALMDKIAQYAIKQAEMASDINLKIYQSIEKVAEKYSKKLNQSEIADLAKLDYKAIYNEWLSESDALLTELFATESFSKLKAEVLNLSMDIKTYFEKQMEKFLELYPVVKTSEINEVYKALHDLKKQVKTLEQKLELIIEEEKKSSNKKVTVK
ncbi:MAG TPA: poly(R)-hydroxyalkanoic acid synthase subunit PhaE [Bacteroidia bacterium]|nr:poly(R)-hydroxyalkanoic acid synthase subunit PhaE [Bacteroidia bacterium]